MVSLWPEDLVAKTQKPPTILLMEQAAHLETHTNSMITAEVFKRTATNPTPGVFNYSFVLIAPALGGYSFSLFKIDHPVELYPVHVFVDDMMKESLPDLFPRERVLEVECEEEFVVVVKKIFNSERTKKIITGLISQSSR